MEISRVIGQCTRRAEQVRRRSPIEAFRARLADLIHSQCDGRYTILARRAGIPVSTMQHYVHHAKRLPGGEHAVRLARALGVTTDYLLAGEESIRPSDRLAHPAAVVPAPRGREEHAELEDQISVVVLECGCPRGCPFAAPLPPVRATRARVLLPADLVPATRVPRRHRLVGVRLTRQLASEGWPAGTRLILDWDARNPTGNHPFLFRQNGHCRLGRLHRSGDGPIISMPCLPHRPTDPGTALPRVFTPEEVEVLGRIVAVIRSL